MTLTDDELRFAGEAIDKAGRMNPEKCEGCRFLVQHWDIHCGERPWCTRQYHWIHEVWNCKELDSSQKHTID